MLEVIVVTAIFVVIGAALLVSFMTGRTSYLQGEESVHVQQEARRAFDAMTNELYEAGHIRQLLSGGGAGAANQPFTGAIGIASRIAQGYNLAECPNAICWGDGLTTNRWLQYRMRPGTNQLVRCSTANPGDNDFTNCRVLANDVQSFSADYAQADGTPPTRTVTLRLRVQRTSAQLPGGSVASGPTPLVGQVELRNVVTE